MDGCPAHIASVPVDHYENFPVASVLLPAKFRDAVEAIYAFARSADDIADEGNLPAEERLRQLAEFSTQLNAIAAATPVLDRLFVRLQAAIRRHDLPIQPFYDLLDAFGQDVVKNRYANFAELRDYCRRSADPIGRLLLRLYRAESSQQLAWSDAICSSLQLINHWQDIGNDWARNRIYLPQDSLARFGVSEAQIAQGRCDDKWRALLGFEVDRARALMLCGQPLGRSLPGRIGLELRLMIAGGLRILEKIEQVGFDVFRHRPTLKSHDWPLLLLRAI
jgi:phytoene synthase